MKTTLDLRDDLLKQAEERAALRGQPLSRYIEEGIEQHLKMDLDLIAKHLKSDEKQSLNVTEWIKSLPKVSEKGVKELESTILAGEFRKIDPSMWQ